MYFYNLFQEHGTDIFHWPQRQFVVLLTEDDFANWKQRYAFLFDIADKECRGMRLLVSHPRTRDFMKTLLKIEGRSEDIIVARLEPGSLKAQGATFKLTRDAM